MIEPDAFRDQPTLTGARVRLEPLSVEHLDGFLAMMQEPENLRLTGTPNGREFTEEPTRQYLSTRQDQHDRADWAIVSQADDEFLGEVVLNLLETANASVNFRIGLAGPHVYGQGYGTEATRLVLDYAFDVVKLHRISLSVYDFNPRAQRVYEKCGFVREGVERESLRWDGQWHNAITMSILSTDPRS